jgi:putative PIN family toxin of toxin-antitoxin system
MSELPHLVIDTNWLLDLWVFDDPRAQPLRSALEAGELRWLATPHMRDEFERVLGYPAVAKRLQANGRAPAALLAEFESHVAWAEPAPRAPVRCADPDDQVFIDLALQQQATLLSKDRAVLACRKRLQALGVAVQPHWP